MKVNCIEFYNNYESIGRKKDKELWKKIGSREVFEFIRWAGNDEVEIKKIDKKSN